MTHQEKPKPPKADRVIRVFISSTFRDMKEERDVLVKRTFPQLRKICEERGVTWGEVDLRWGVTDEQKAEGKVLPICLEEIKRCRPYFIGLLGERYGWVPDEVPQELIKQESWLAEHLDNSVTEMEILHGVLRNPEMAEHAFFYFRDPEYVNRLPEGTKRLDFTSENGDAHKKLDKLKDRIRKSGLPVRENYPDPKALGELVLQDLTNIIDKLYPPEEKIDPLDKDALEHEAFAQSRARVYIGRDEYFDRLDKHIQSTGPPLVLLGDSGSGKSALLANWALRYQKEHPHDMLIMHFIGASPYSADWSAMLRRIMGELKRRLDIQQDIPDKPDELRSAFANWLHMASAKGKVILILDALNQLEDRDGAPDLVWLPPVIPENIRLFLSTLPGRPLDDLKKRGWPTLAIEPLTTEERKVFIEKYLAQYTKSLSPSHLEKIANANQTSNPLYLKVLLEELRLFGEYEKLDKRINHYLEARSPYELYGRVLARWEEDYEEENDLVGNAMSLIWASRRGLSETELLELLGRVGEPLPQAVWSPLFLAARESLVSRSGFLSFAHNFLRDSVRDTYMPTEEYRNKAHLRLADYFEKQGLGPRKIDELPWQLAKAKAWQRLYELLADLSFFEAAWRNDQFDVKAYWALLEGSSLNMVDAYRSILDAPHRVPNSDYIWDVATLLSDTGHLVEALSLREYLLEYFREARDPAKLQACLGNQALILYNRGDLDRAMALLKEQERLCRELGDKQGLSTSLGNQGRILQVQLNLDGAMALLKEQEQLCRELGDKQGLSNSLGNQARNRRAQGDLDGALDLHKQHERLSRELGDKQGLSISLSGQSRILHDRGDFDGALVLLKEQERLCRELGDKQGLSNSLFHQATTFHAKGNVDKALTLLKEQERLCRELGYKLGLNSSLSSQAKILIARGDVDAATELLKENQPLCRELGDKRGLSDSLRLQALVREIKGDAEGALTLHREQERLCRELGDKQGLLASLGNQANIHYNRGEFDRAMRLYKEQEQICRELGNKDGLVACLGNQALILDTRGDLDGAMALHKEAERIYRDLGNKQGLAISLINQAELLANKRGCPNEGLPLAEEAYHLATTHGYIALAQQIRTILDSIRAQLR